ncbi:ACD11 homolog protein-like isoform X1 [Andrographis paniculata]|uniref:ACD11 homolog protein-like isoform X1 n=1 Tax=Andrographis paniculata TaxID=175694 RepID=UPI0021E73711|nr:ACD11 homolog protein-like isoform X1 [Andrographis paniculata]
MAMKFHSLFSRAERSCAEKRSEDSSVVSKVSTSKEISVEEEATTAAGELRPLSAVADAFEELSRVVKSNGYGYDLDLKTFCNACSLVSILFGCLGIAFKFAELEYSHKVRNLAEASDRYKTLNSILECDLQNGSVKTQGSLTRNLRRVRQGLDLIRALFHNFLSSEVSCLKEAASEAYGRTCAPYHTWAVRTAAYAGMYALPTRDQLLLKLNESSESAKREMVRYINASTPVIEYIDRLYTSRNISLDW